MGRGRGFDRQEAESGPARGRPEGQGAGLWQSEGGVKAGRSELRSEPLGGGIGRAGGGVRAGRGWSPSRQGAEPGSAGAGSVRLEAGRVRACLRVTMAAGTQRLHYSWRRPCSEGLETEMRN